jgi:Mg-chelatase subunit ChlD
MKNSHPKTAAGRRALAAALSLAALLACAGTLLQGPSRAQSNANAGRQQQQAAADATAEVNREGYTLRPSGLALNNLPLARFDFSVEKKDASGKPVQFSMLKAADIQVRINDRPVQVRDGDLKLTASDPAGVLIMIDGSGSMITAKAGVNKLDAAKTAVDTFINNLGEKDTVAIGAFDEKPYWVTDPTTDKAQLRGDVGAFQIDPAGSKYTRLYAAVEKAVTKAAERGLRNVILISDGWEDSPESRRLTGAALEEFKRAEEQRIVKLSRDSGVRVYTIAIGDELGEGLSYVDRAALSNMSKGANGGDAVYLCVPQPGADSHCDEQVTQEALEGKLKQTLDQIRQSFRYGYSLEVRLDQSLARDAQHKLWIAPAVVTAGAGGDLRRVLLPVEYHFRWPTGSKSGEVQGMTLLKPAIFIQSPAVNVPVGSLTLLYALIMALLVSMGVIPIILGRIVNASRTSGAVVVVKGRSQLAGKSCPNEGTYGRQYALKEGDAVVVCPKCQTPHHLACWLYNSQRCMIRTCEFPLQIPANILSKHGVEAAELKTA